MKKIIGAAAILVLLPAIVFAQDAGKKKAYFFFLPTCSHCHNVDNYFQSNGIYDKYDISKLDASNPFNSQLLLKFYKANNYPPEQSGGVPVVVFGDKFLLGDSPIIDNFVKEIDASQNSNELPSPDTANSNNPAADQGNTVPTQNNQPMVATENSVATGNKKSYFPVIIGALIVIVAGGIIYVNRKKS